MTQFTPFPRLWYLFTRAFFLSITEYIAGAMGITPSEASQLPSEASKAFL